MQAKKLLRKQGKRLLSKLEFGNSPPKLLRVEEVSSQKILKDLDILFISDLHLTSRTDKKILSAIIKIAKSNKPDCILVGGDILDSRAAYLKVYYLLKKLSTICKVAVVPGNHDYYIGLTKLKQTIKAAGALWLEDENLVFAENNCTIFSKLSKKVSTNTFNIFCSHNPNIFKKAVSRGANLVLGGHYHGGQFVFFKWRKRLFPGAFLYPWNVLRYEWQNSTLIVSRGIIDTLPIRFNCPRELVLCKITKDLPQTTVLC